MTDHQFAHQGSIADVPNNVKCTRCGIPFNVFSDARVRLHDELYRDCDLYLMAKIHEELPSFDHQDAVSTLKELYTQKDIETLAFTSILLTKFYCMVC